MSFELVRSRHKQDSDFPQRTYDLNLYLSVLDGTFYDVQPYPFHQEWVGERFITMLDRRPNVPAGSSEIVTQVKRHVSMLFSDDHFPEIETENEAAREFIKDWIKESDLVGTESRAAYLGSIGSVGKQLVVMEQPDGSARMWVREWRTPYLKPTFASYDPNLVVGMVYKRKYTGLQLMAMDPSYNIADEDLRKLFFFQIVWDDKIEQWFTPWKVSDERDARKRGRKFTPSLDKDRSTVHNLGFCPWDWVRNPGLAEGVDGACTFKTALDPAVAKDFLDSQIQLAIRYSMAPTLVVSTPQQTPGQSALPTAPIEGAGEDTGVGFVKSSSSFVEVPEKAKVYYAEITGDGIERAQEESTVLRKTVIESMHGDRVDPAEITQGHQGSQTMAMIQTPMLEHVRELRSAYGASLLRIIKMAMRVVEKKPVRVFGKPVDKAAAKADDLLLRWGAFYMPTSQEKFSEAQAAELNLKNRLISRDTGRKNVAAVYSIENGTLEEQKIAQDMADDVAFAKQMASANAVVQERIDAT